MSQVVDYDAQAVKNFKKYLQIPSVQPNVDYSGCVEFVKQLGSSLGLEVMVEHVAPEKPVVVLTWKGENPDLPSLLLSSHMDVVPVFTEYWTYNPFGAEQDTDGNIYARGAQDMKCVGVQYLEAVHRLILKDYRPKRTIHICFTPDEEIGSVGMKLFVNTDTFKKLGIGCALDEGGQSPNDTFFLFYGERTPYYVEISCSGTPGHGSLLIDNTAGEKIAIVIKKFMDRRAEAKSKSDNSIYFSGCTSINLTKLEGGVQTNVVPPVLTVTFDCRVSPNEDHDEFEKWIENVCKEAGEGVKVNYVNKQDKIGATNLTEDNPWWVTMRAQFDKLGIKVSPMICPAVSDARYIRQLGIPVFGFSPINNTAPKLHGHNEYLNIQVFLTGIEIYCELIPALADW